MTAGLKAYVIAAGERGEYTMASFRSSIVEGVLEDEFRQMNEFPRSELSRSWAAFGMEPLL